MKTNFLLISSLFLASIAAHATTLTTGTPGNSLLASPTGPSLNIGPLIKFDSLTPASTFLPATYASVGISSISSPDGLVVDPFSTQSSPNELFDNSSDGTANIKILLATGAAAIGIGIADSDALPAGTLTLQALNASGAGFGSVFTIAVPQNTVNAGNGYYEISDTIGDIYGLQILQTSPSANYSGLAIDDLQVASPEPASIALIGAGALLLALTTRLRKRA